MYLGVEALGKQKFIIMGAIALFAGSSAVFAADYWLKSNVQTVIKEVPAALPVVASPAPTRTIVVAGEPFNYGDTLNEDNLREVAWAAAEMPVGAFETIEEMIDEGDRAALGAIALGEPVLSSKVTGEGAAPSLSKLLTPGYRAVAIDVNESKGASGFIVPGDRVDIVLAREFGDSEEEINALRAASIAPVSNTVIRGRGSVNTGRILSNVRVISVSQTASENTAEPILGRTMTVEVLPQQATLLTSAQLAGELSFHLRGAGDVGLGIPEIDTQGIDFTQTSSYGDTPKNKTTSIRVRMGDQVSTHDVEIEGAAR